MKILINILKILTFGFVKVGKFTYSGLDSHITAYRLNFVHFYRKVLSCDKLSGYKTMIQVGVHMGLFMILLGTTAQGQTTIGSGPSLGGLEFDPNDPDVLYVAEQANTGGAWVYRWDVTRDGSGRITGMTNRTAYRFVPLIDSNFEILPNGNVMYATFSCGFSSFQEVWFGQVCQVKPDGTRQCTEITDIPGWSGGTVNTGPTSTGGITKNPDWHPFPNDYSLFTWIPGNIYRMSLSSQPAGNGFYSYQFHGQIGEGQSPDGFAFSNDLEGVEYYKGDQCGVWQNDPNRNGRDIVVMASFRGGYLYYRYLNSDGSIGGPSVLISNTGLWLEAAKRDPVTGHLIGTTWETCPNAGGSTDIVWRYEFGGSCQGDCVVPDLPTGNTYYSYCTGQAIPTLTATPPTGAVIDWYGGASGTTLLAQGTNSYSPSGPGTYFARSRSTSDGCESSSLSIVVEEFPASCCAAAPTSGGNQSYCEGSTVPTLSVSSSASPVNWYDSDTKTNLLSTGLTYTPSGANLPAIGQTRSYFVEAEGSCGGGDVVSIDDNLSSRTASSVYSAAYGPDKSDIEDLTDGWNPANTGSGNFTDWLQLDFGSITDVRGLYTAGYENTYYITSFRVKYSNDGVNFTTLGTFSRHNSPALFTTNFGTTISARYLRIETGPFGGGFTGLNAKAFAITEPSTTYSNLTEVQLTRNASPSAPTVGGITQPSCTTTTGSVVLTGLPSGNWTLTSSPSGFGRSGSTTSTTITGLSPSTTYTFTVTNSSNCTSGASANVVMNAIPTCDTDGDGEPDDTDPAPNDPCVYSTSHTPTLANTSSTWKAQDCDGDGVTNGQELTDATDPLDGCSYLASSQTYTSTSTSWRALDCDSDGLTNGQEVDPDGNGSPGPNGTNPLNPDTDGDGVTDGAERSSGGADDPLTDPNNSCDYNLAEQTLTPSTTWLGADCDGDGVTNGDEYNGSDGNPATITDNTDPLDPCDLNTADISLAVTTTEVCGPDLTPTIEINSLNFTTSGASRDFIVNIFEVLNKSHTPGSTIAYRINKLSGFDITYPTVSGTSDVFGGTANSNSDWLFSENSNFITVTAKAGVEIPAGGSKQIGFNLKRKAGIPRNTGQNITVTVIFGSGGEEVVTNNLIETTLTAN